MIAEKCRTKTKAGLPGALGAPLYFRSGSAHEQQWNFLPAIQQRLRFRIALDSLRSSIKVRENEVKKKNYREDAFFENKFSSTSAAHLPRLCSSLRA